MASSSGDGVLHKRSLKNATIHLDSINSINKTTPGCMVHMLTEFGPQNKEPGEIVILELVDFYFVNSFYNVIPGETRFYVRLVEDGENVNTILDQADPVEIYIPPGSYSLATLTTVLNVVSAPISTSNYTITAFEGNETTLRNKYTTSGPGTLYVGTLHDHGRETLRKLGFVPKLGDDDPDDKVVRPNGITWYPITTAPHDGPNHHARYTMDLRAVSTVSVNCSRLKSPLYASSHNFRSSGTLLVEPVKVTIPNLQHEVYSEKRKSFVLNTFESGLYEFNLRNNETGRRLDTHGLSWGLTFEVHYVKLAQPDETEEMEGFQNIPITFEAQSQIDRLNRELSQPRKRLRN